MNVSSDLTKEPGFELYMTGRLKPSQEKTINSQTNRVCIASLFNCTLQQHSAQKITCSELQPAVQKDKKKRVYRKRKQTWLSGCFYTIHVTTVLLRMESDLQHALPQSPESV